MMVGWGRREWGGGGLERRKMPLFARGSSNSSFNGSYHLLYIGDQHRYSQSEIHVCITILSFPKSSSSLFLSFQVEILVVQGRSVTDSSWFVTIYAMSQTAAKVLNIIIGNRLFMSNMMLTVFMCITGGVMSLGMVYWENITAYIFAYSIGKFVRTNIDCITRKLYPIYYKVTTQFHFKWVIITNGGKKNLLHTCD